MAHVGGVVHAGRGPNVNLGASMVVRRSRMAQHEEASPDRYLSWCLNHESSGRRLLLMLTI
jgi:hypothetical protein